MLIYDRIHERDAITAGRGSVPGLPAVIHGNILVGYYII